MGETQPIRDRRGYATFPPAPDASKPAASPLRSSPWLSRLLLTFVDPLVATGSARQLETSDFWPLDPENRAAEASREFAREFDRRGRSLLSAVVHRYGGAIALTGAAAALSAASGVLAPVVLHHVVDAVETPRIDLAGDLGLWLGLFFAARLATAAVSAHAGLYLQVVAGRLENALRALLFAKALRRSAQGKAAAGEPGPSEEEETQASPERPQQEAEPPADLANLFSTDVGTVLFATFQLNSLWILPLQIGVVVYLLYAVIGAAAFAGLGVIVASMVLSFAIFVSVGGAFEDIMASKDARMKVVREVFGAIQVVKLNAWEDKFAARIAAARTKELSAVARFVYTISATVFILWASPILVSTVSFAVYALAMGQTLTAAKVFTSIALFNAIREPLRQLPTVLQMTIQAAVSLGRINDYLALPEFDPDNVARLGKDDASSVLPAGVCVAVHDAAFGWSPDAPTLQSVDLEVQQGDLVVVHGPVGSGKSTLCNALLGETHKLRGQVAVRGAVAYYSQQTWIQNMSLRDNILFGLPLDQDKYQRVLEACGLLPDLGQLPAGDATEIGQKGVNLSGGQKARVCLARACYSDADVFILDSPLAAVDAVVQKQIFNRCICGLLAAKTVVLVTHNPDIIASEAANVKVLVSDGGDKVNATRRIVERPRSEYAIADTSQSSDKEGDAADPQDKTDSGRLVVDEERVAGRVSKDVYWAYLDALGGVKVCALVLLVQVLWQAFQIGSDLWLSRWTGQTVGREGEALVDTAYNMTVYALLGSGSALMVLLRVVTIGFVGLRASRHLFDSMTTALLHAPLRFFDKNPIGRIVNRYGDDISSVDLSLQFAYGTVLAYAFFTVCQLATAVYMVSFLGVLIVPLVFMYTRVANFYLASSREVVRHLRVKESPMLSHVTQSEEGVHVLRAFGERAVQNAVAENYALNDSLVQVWVVKAATDQWFALRIQLIGCGVVVLIVSSLIYLRAVLSPGLVGLAFTYALSVDGGLAEFVQMWSWLEIQMVSPERLLEYTAIPSEGSSKVSQPVEPPAQWPEHGAIEFSRVAFRYDGAGGPLVLQDVSFSVSGREKVGVVGRTGAGKSSLTMALFRINELASGAISIDGVDISRVSLRALRSRMTIIPQSPVLFKGSLRNYFDPFEEFTDANIWSSLERVDMKATVAALPGSLSYKLTENGDNFSVGERQLLCMARALLTKSRIVVMDEATASIDHATEKKLQEMVARDFANVTVLTIAHRLATVLDSDRILVMSDGKAVEMGPPRELVKNPDGAFYQLAKDGGYLEKLLAV